ncbi:ABC transporter ATP-binding protein [Propionispora vibrioides]|uniref:Iron complex transport system ATP-binding protein n=1 Tax=Propionispora vibrioides TaxID=112903 RepID=A0A1H8XV90_9FIRM|nr:ABC transporter ATP-binding protein [Propionispora vibrioides]SEP43964.1 iron complex transport system ATP-binding protein [Propionispora vibrioides]
MELTINALAVAIQNKTIVKDVSLTVRPGSFVGILGPNGSGKSTLLRTIYRALSPQSGAILLNREPLQDIKIADAAKQIGVVGQFHSLSCDITVLEMVLLGRTPHKRRLAGNNREDYEIARQSLQQVGMENFADRNFSTLSGGEKQRIILARALAQQPHLLLLDEPTNHLDIKYQLELLSIVKSLDISVLAVLHDLNLAAMYCDDLYILKEGQLIAGGTPGDVLTPHLIRQVYEIDCHVMKHPRTGCLSISYCPAGQERITG